MDMTNCYRSDSVDSFYFYSTTNGSMSIKILLTSFSTTTWWCKWFLYVSPACFPVNIVYSATNLCRKWLNDCIVTDIQNAKMPRLYKLYTHRILIYFIFVIRMFCDLIWTCSPSSLITKIDWINLDRRRSKKEVSDKIHSIFSRIRMFWNNHDTTALHNSVRRDGVLFSLFSFFHNIEITRGSLLEKNMDITKYFKKSNDKLGGGVLDSFVPWFSTSSVLSAAREINSV